MVFLPSVSRIYSIEQFAKNLRGLAAVNFINDEYERFPFNIVGFHNGHLLLHVSYRLCDDVSVGVRLSTEFSVEIVADVSYNVQRNFIRKQFKYVVGINDHLSCLFVLLVMNHYGMALHLCNDKLATINGFELCFVLYGILYESIQFFLP